MESPAEFITVEGMEQQVLRILRTLPLEHVAEVLDFAEFLQLRRRLPTTHISVSLEESFGVWREREDLGPDSRILVRTMRSEWQAREDRLGDG